MHRALVALLLFTLAVSSSCDYIDNALVDIITAMPALASLGWNASDTASVCQGNRWYGVSCIFRYYNPGSGVIYKSLPFTVTIRNINLGGTLSGSWGQLDLGTLQLTNCSVGGSLPVSLFPFNSSLMQLELYDNKFTSGIPAEISNAKQLQIINMANNQLSGTVPTSLSTLPLKSLDISKNLFVGPWPSSISNISALTNPGPLCVTKQQGTTCLSTAYASCGCSPSLCAVSSSCTPTNNIPSSGTTNFLHTFTVVFVTAIVAICTLMS